MRALIREKLAAGDPPDQIIAYFVSRYGEWILLEPPRRGLGWFVWIAPMAALFLGGVLAARFLRRTVTPVRTSSASTRGPHEPPSATGKER